MVLRFAGNSTALLYKSSEEALAEDCLTCYEVHGHFFQGHLSNQTSISVLSGDAVRKP